MDGAGEPEPGQNGGSPRKLRILSIKNIEALSRGDNLCDLMSPSAVPSSRSGGIAISSDELEVAANKIPSNRSVLPPPPPHPRYATLPVEDDDEESKDSLSHERSYEECYFTKIPFANTKAKGWDDPSLPPMLVPPAATAPAQTADSESFAPLIVNNIVPFGGVPSPRRAQTREETLSQLSELTQSDVLKMLSEEGSAALDLVQAFPRATLDDASNMDQGALRNLEQKVRFLLARNRAYERAMKLTQLIANEDLREQTDQSKDLLYFFGAFFVISLFNFLPLCTLSLAEQRSIFKDTNLYSSVRSDAFANALYFSAGSAAPLLMELVLMTAYSSMCSAKVWASEAIAKIDFTRLVFCLTIMVPAVVVAAVALGSEKVLLPESVYVCFNFWQYCMFSIAGVHFFIKYTPAVMSKEYMMTTCFVFVLCNVLQPWATISQNFTRIYNYCYFFQIAAALLYMYYLYNLALKVWAGKLNSAVDGVLTPTAYGVIGINAGFCSTLLLDYMIQFSNLNMDGKSLTVFLCCWHVYVKCVMVVLLDSLPLSLVKRDIDRTITSLKEVLSVSAVDDTAQIPLDIVVESNEDTSVVPTPAADPAPLRTPSLVPPTSLDTTPVSPSSYNNSCENLLPQRNDLSSH